MADQPLDEMRDGDTIDLGAEETSRRTSRGVLIRPCGTDCGFADQIGVNRENIEYLLPQVRQLGLLGAFEQALNHYARAGQPAGASVQINVRIAAAPSAMPGEISANYRFNPADDVRLKFPQGAKAILAIWDGGRAKEYTFVPLAPLMAGARDLRGTHTVYGHTFCKTDGSIFGIRGDRTEPSYVGQTKQGWYRRWKQHVASAAAGSPYRFAEAIRRFKGNAAIFHEVVSVGIGQDEAYEIEEYLVEKFALYPHGFNMIPGGYAGIRYLSQLGAQVGPREWERRDAVIERLVSRYARESRPNPLAAALWKDDDYAASIICANPNNFSKQRVDEIRYMASLGRTAGEIAADLGCREQRVADLLSGETYSRVH